MTDPPVEYQGARSASRRTGALGPSERAVQTVGPSVFPPLEALWETRWGRAHGGECGSMASNPGSGTGGESQMANLGQRHMLDPPLPGFNNRPESAILALVSSLYAGYHTT